MRINKAKAAADRRAHAAATLAQSFIASGAPYRCSAAVLHDSAMIESALCMARVAIASGLSFGSSASKRDARHIAGLMLDSADRLVSAHYYPAAA